MPRPADHLRALVERMSGGEPADATAARLAGAVGGESPARFHGRVVMERAAWFVSRTDRTLHAIAEDCGASAEVFARAFRREFGALPSAWRRDPTSFLLDAPNDVHFHPPGALRLPARERSGPAELVVDIVGHHVDLVGNLLDRALVTTGAERGTSSQHEATSTLAELVQRMESFVLLVHGAEADVVETEPASVASLRERLDRTGPAYVDAVALLAATGRLDEALVDAFSPEPSVLTFGAMVVHAVTDADGLRAAAARHLDTPQDISR
ncbi:helix-turn-helix domain-containing protein [Nocardioides xinjiangensis]|uniref:helix-turn-helix domain-containing protein n=1 Tax=Nocardioides xinjiangensis TaxID=2817376 RepID=UPI001B313A5C|nr:helix-turn-helix domain-containing protein [Nocardioides sp. SYSU D00778]